MGVEQHLVGLQGIGSQQEGPAVRQLDVGYLELHAVVADHREVFAPVELECLAGAESQRNEGATPRSLLLSVPIGPPLSRKGSNTVVGPVETKCHQIGMHLLQRLTLFAGLPGIGLQPARQLLGKGIKLARPLGRREMRLDRIGGQMFGHGIARQARATGNLPDR